ncbi:MAG: hypothetical protein ACREH3_05875 [Geminicoccales bacterium]
MSNRLEPEFPRATWRTVPLIGPDGTQLDLRHLERASEASHAATRRGLVVLAALVRYAAHGAAGRAPQGSYRDPMPAERLTADCC